MSKRVTERKKSNPNNNQVIDKYFITKEWDKTFKHRTLDIDEVNHRLYNDLPLDDLIDEATNKYNRKK